MADPWSSIAVQVLADHEIHLFLTMDGVTLAGPEIGLGRLAEAANGSGCLPSDQHAALSGRYRHTAVWERAAGDAAPDFHPHVAALAAGARDRVAAVWTLGQQARRLVGSADLYPDDAPAAARVRKRLELVFSKAADARLRSHGLVPRPLQVTIDRVTLHAFSTGRSILHAIVRLDADDGSPLGAIELLEAQVALGRFEWLAWSSAPERRFGLAALLRMLVLGADAAARPADRVATHTYVQLEAPATVEDADRLGTHLARHYTTDYALLPDAGGVARVRAFATVGHVVALEGAATVVCPDAATGTLAPFLEGFRTTTFRGHYVPIGLLARHEHAFLVDCTARAVATSDEGEGAVERLGRLRSESLAFRLFFRFSEISGVTMHNAVNRAFREVLGLDRMLDELADDIVEVEAHLRLVEERRVHHRYYWAGLVGGAALAGLTTFTILKEGGPPLVGLLGKLMDVPLGKVADPVESWAKLAGVGLGLLVAGITVWLGLKRKPQGGPEHRDHDLAQHALIEHMLLAAKK
ncbi:MAG: hypothetical protein AB7P02_18135 [Alphaproteobacteria bacterium]